MDTDQAHTHVPLPPSTQPLRSALKHTHRDSRPNSPSPSSTFILSPSSTFALSPTDSPQTPRSSLPPFEYNSPTTSSLPLPLSSASTALSHSPSQVSASTSAANYTPKVSFDTFENPLASMFSFTLSAKSAGYKRSRNTRVFLCAASPDESGREALDWALESLVQDGDELIVFRGVDEEVLEKMDHDVVREEARELMRNVQEKSAEDGPERKLSLILEYIPGKITDTLDRLIALYRPESVVVGTRGRRPWVMGIGGIGSVSKYCLSHSPVPVIVVRPNHKLRKAIEKRRADPKRGRHFENES